MSPLWSLLQAKQTSRLGHPNRRRMVHLARRCLPPLLRLCGRYSLPPVGVAMKRRQFIHLTAGAIALVATRFARAETYPSHPVRVIVGFPPGGPTDIYARLIGEWLANRLGQPFIVENRPGAGSTIGIEAVVTSPPDGYTLLLISSSAAISVSYYKDLDFDLHRDIAPVCGIAFVPMAMVVNPSVPAKTVPEFIAYAKENPGNINMASVGNGTTPQMAGGVFKINTNIDLLPLPSHAVG